MSFLTLQVYYHSTLSRNIRPDASARADQLRAASIARVFGILSSQGLCD
jgi:hypothetical protein